MMRYPAMVELCYSTRPLDILDLLMVVPGPGYSFSPIILISFCSFNLIHTIFGRLYDTVVETYFDMYISPPEYYFHFHVHSAR